MEIRLPGTQPSLWSRFIVHLAPELLSLYRENAKLRERNADLHHQNEQLRSAKPMTPEHWTQMERVVKEHTVMYQDQQTIVRYLRQSSPSVFNNPGLSVLPLGKLVVKLMGGDPDALTIEPQSQPTVAENAE